jgi:hypothetical protein
MYLDWALVGITTCMLRELNSTSKNPPSIGVDEKSIGYSTSIGCLTSSTFVVFFAACFSSSKSLIITNAGVGVKNCLRKPHNVSSSFSPIVTACFNASKISCPMFFSSLELSLFFQNTRGSLDVSGSM